MNTKFKKSMFFKIVLFGFLSSIYVCSSVVPFYNPKHHHYVNIEDASLSNVEVELHVDEMLKTGSLIAVEVWYESLCPDSKKFIIQQLYPTWKKLGKYMSIEFKPFGKSEFSPNSDGGWDFTCQHGPNECKGNMYQACFLKLPGTDLSERVETVNCIMSDDYPDNATLHCMDQTGVKKPTKEEVDRCANSVLGQQYLHDLGVETKSLKPPVDFIPRITFNMIYDPTWQEQSLQNFEQVLCNNFLRPVPECGNIV